MKTLKQELAEDAKADSLLFPIITSQAARVISVWLRPLALISTNTTQHARYCKVHEVVMI